MQGLWIFLCGLLFVGFVGIEGSWVNYFRALSGRKKGPLQGISENDTLLDFIELKCLGTQK